MTSTRSTPQFGPADTAVEKLVKLSRFYGADYDFVVCTGGNTSVKDGERMYVKASGCALGTVTPERFVPMDRNRLIALVDADFSDDPRRGETQFSQGILDARIEPENPVRPSIECVLHAMLPGRYVVHTHATLANMVGCCINGKVLAREMFGDDALWVACAPPGLTLARSLAQELKGYSARTGRDYPNAVLMQNHGLVVCGEEPEEILKRTNRILEGITERLEGTSGENVFGEVTRIEPRRMRELVQVITDALPALRGAPEGKTVVGFDDSDIVMNFVGSARGKEIASGGPLIPDHVVHCMSAPLWFDPHNAKTPEDIKDHLRQKLTEHTRSVGLVPNVVLVARLGMFTVGDGRAHTDLIGELYRNAIRVFDGALRLGGIHYMGGEQRRYIETAQARAYRENARSMEHDRQSDST